MELKYAYKVYDMLSAVDKYSHQIDEVNRVKRIIVEANNELDSPLHLGDYIKECKDRVQDLDNKIQAIFADIEKL